MTHAPSDLSLESLPEPTLHVINLRGRRCVTVILIFCSLISLYSSTERRLNLLSHRGYRNNCPLSPPHQIQSRNKDFHAEAEISVVHPPPVHLGQGPAGDEARFPNLVWAQTVCGAGRGWVFGWAAAPSEGGEEDRALPRPGCLRISPSPPSLTLDK